MEIRYTIKIKDKHNAPEFKKGMGKGVLAIQDAIYKEVTDKDFESPVFQGYILDFKRQLLEDWLEVVAEVIDIKKERKKKLERLNERS